MAEPRRRARAASRVGPGGTPLGRAWSRAGVGVTPLGRAAGWAVGGPGGTSAEQRP